MNQIRKTIVDYELADGTIVVGERITNRSMVQWDLTRTKRKFPPVEDAPMLWLNFVTWHHLAEVTKVVDCKWDDWIDGYCVDVQYHKADEKSADVDDVRQEAFGDPVDPTQPDESGT